MLLIVNDNDIAVRNDVASTSRPSSSARWSSRSKSREIEKSLGFTHDVFEPNGDNRDRMDSVRDNVWPLLGLTPPAHGALAGPTPGGGYYPELGPGPGTPSRFRTRATWSADPSSRADRILLPGNE